MSSQIASRVNSALWAAYGDAVGFITELRDAEALKKIIASRRVTELVTWKRRVGGRFGPTLLLPQGCYSDDTQLRLATSRAVRGDGTFDVEAFAKIELPVWLSYYLGAGRGTRTAARNLERKDVAWYSNFFDEKGSTYLESGGNGAAMRIQPHMWAERRPSSGEELLDVLKNALTTHGHPRGFLGALFHAECLSFALRTGTMPGPEAWSNITESLSNLPSLLAADEDLQRVWRPTWEAKAKRTLKDAVSAFQEEHRGDVKAATALLSGGDPEATYRAVLRRLGGLDARTAGAGSTTSLLAAVLAHLYKGIGAKQALLVAANQFGSDTDTIATMAGALLGVTEKSAPDVLPPDAAYIKSEALRLEEVARGKNQQSFRYPDLLHWRAPKTALDVVCRTGGQLVVAGLGPASATSESTPMAGHENTGWQWVQLSFGQSILIKHRNPIPDGSASVMTLPPQSISGNLTATVNARATLGEASRETPRAKGIVESAQPTLFEGQARQGANIVERRRLEDITGEVIDSGFDAAVIGRNLKWLLDHSKNPIEAAVAFAAIIAKARGTRQPPSRS